MPPNGSRSLGEIASRRARHAIHRALDADPPLSRATLAVLHAVVWLTVGYSKPDDQVTRAVLAHRARVSERTVTRALEKLVELDVVEWTPARAAGQLGTIALPETPICPECRTEPETPICPESSARPETDSSATRDRNGHHPGQMHGSLPRETAGTPKPKICSTCGEVTWIFGMGHVACACERARELEEAIA